MNTDKLTIALNEFVHVGGALVVVIAVVSILTGFMREYIPQDKLQKKLTKHEKWGPILGAFLGMLTPFCSASVVPVTMGMASMGVSLGTVLSFLISAPLCNFIVMAMVYAVFGFKITASYFLITFSAAIFGGWLISKTPWRNEIKRGEELEGKKAAACCAAPPSRSSKPEPEPECCGAPVTNFCAIPEPEPACCGAPVTSCCETPAAATEPTKPQLALRFALALFKKIIPYVLLGALISGVSAAYLSADIVEKYVGGDSLLSIIISAVIGVPVYLRIEMAVPLLKVLIVKGMGIGPAIALIIGGTGASLPEIALVSSVLKPKAVIAFITIVLSTAILGGILIQSIV
ncbi:permease [Coraliomargarita sp. SDUM461004]|uniref:Permease n=1 Tax=Thalassobacterium sedimentorum TaxID=3041258 RepID=A0ABU1AM32_9BACT|nr:permease [Coraliomargarita sp. SDUM461004]MDQ8195724.1 permease [Coraliomargarita sp. SDUM461004]